MIDPSSPLPEFIKAAFSVPGPFSSNGANNTAQVKTSGLGSVSKAKSADRQGSLKPVELCNVRPGTADPCSDPHQDRITALEAQHSLGYQKPSRRSLALLDPGSIARPGTTVPQSKAPQEYSVGLEIKAPL